MAPIEENKGTLAVEKPLAAFPLKNVLFATDFSDTSEAALPYAAAICRRFGSTLHVVHVLSDASLLFMSGGVDYVSMSTLYDDANNEAKQKIEQIAERLEGIPYHSYVRHGRVWSNLASIIDENEIELIVVGTHGRTGLGKLLLGSVAEDILRHARCPVLTVGPKVSGRNKLPALPARGRDIVPAELDLRQIVVATNFAENSPAIAQAAASLAQQFCARLTLLHVIEDYSHLGSQPEPMDEGVRQLQALIPKDATLQQTPETVIEFGAAGEGILKVASQRESDLIVLGARTAEQVGSTHLPWSTANHVIANANCPVLTVRG